MSSQNISSYLRMAITTLVPVSVPVCVSSLLLNLFLVCCMFFPKQEAERLKQPLNVLLGTFVGCNISLQVCIFLVIIQQDIPDNMGSAVLEQMTLFAMRTSISSSLWLNVFYYCQIVPTQRSIFICLKRNIRFFTYSALIVDKIFFLISFAVGITYRTYRTVNETYTIPNEKAEQFDMIQLFKTEFKVRTGYSLLCLCVMLASSCATVRYLQRHMKSMEGSSSSSNSTHLQRQMRVTITGILQTVLYFLCSVLLILCEVLYYEAYINIDPTDYFTYAVLCFYSFGASINLCVGQSIFRQWVFIIWQKCFQVFALISL